jgi:hypothetical protein
MKRFATQHLSYHIQKAGKKSVENIEVKVHAGTD